MGLMKSARLAGGIALAVLLPVAALAVSIALSKGGSSRPAPARAPEMALPVRQAAYLGVFENGTPGSYASIAQFTAATGRRPDIALYFSDWDKPFATAFATTARAHGAVLGHHVHLAFLLARQELRDVGRHGRLLRSAH
jgi:hypothetical protein